MKVLDAIRLLGLVPRARRYVHLAEHDYAVRVQCKYRAHGVLLRVRAEEAARCSAVRFWRASDVVWLSDPVPNQFIDLVVKVGEAVSGVVPFVLDPKDRDAMNRAFRELFMEQVG